MEFRYLVRLLLSKWWLVIPTFVVAVAATVIFTLAQSPVYNFSHYQVFPLADMTSLPVAPPAE